MAAAADATQRVELYVPRKWYDIRAYNSLLLHILFPVTSPFLSWLQAMRELMQSCGDLLIVRSSATNRLIGADDHGSVQINVGHVDANGVFTGEYTTFAFCGMVRTMGESDNAFNRLAAEKNLIKDMQKFSTSDKFTSQ